MKSNIFLYNIKTNYPVSKHTGEFGLLRCKYIFRRMGWIPREINQQDDVGLDLIVEVTKKDSNGNYIPLGQLIGIQIKAGTSYYYENKYKNKYFILTSTDEHKRNWDYWCNHQLPIFIFFYNEELQLYSFLSINNLAAYEEGWNGEEPLPLKSYKIFNFKLEINNDDLDYIKKKFLEAIREKGDLANIISLIDSVYYDDNKSLESIMILSKNYQTRSSSILALLFPHILLSKKDNIIREAFKALIDRINDLRWLPVHMENIRKLYKNILNDLSIDIWGRILSVVTDHEFYSIEPEDDSFMFCNCPGPETISFLIELDDYESLFLKIAKTVKYSPYVRINALALCLFGSYVVNYYINNGDYGPEWERFDRDYLNWKGIHIKDYFLEEKIKSFLIRNNLLDLVANYYNIPFPELRNKKLDEFLIK